MTIEENVALRQYSALKVGGVAQYFAHVSSLGDLKGALKFAKNHEVTVQVVGEGTNTFFTSGILPYLFIKMQTKGIEVISENEREVVLKVAAGENWDEFVAYVVERELSGIEALSAIPGSVGAAPFQNIGAYGLEVKDTIVFVETYDTKADKVIELSNAECKFRYRDSIFKSEERGRYIILSVMFRLSHEKSHVPTYEGVQAYFEERGIENPTLKEIREAIIAIRASKLPDPSVVPNLGSFFKNPVVSHAHAEKLREKFPDIKMYEVEGGVKIPAGWLVERAFGKDVEIGCMRTWKDNALVLTNPEGKCDVKNVLDAQKEITKKVKEMFDIELEREPILVE